MAQGLTPSRMTNGHQPTRRLVSRGPLYLRSLLFLLTAGFYGVMGGRASSQTFTVLHSFTPMATNSGGIYTNSDGAASMGALVLSGNTLYGAATEGGASGNGTVFAVNTDGTGFKVLHTFTALDDGTNLDGSYAQSFFMNGSWYNVGQNPGLVLSGGTLYGTTASGGIWGNGTVFAVKVDGSGFTNLHNFNPTNTDGYNPRGGLALASGLLYGTTASGTVFAIGTDGTGFTNVHTFGYSEGIGPNGLTLWGDTLFGTTYSGGGFPFSTPYGTVFSLQTNGTNFKVLYNFSNGTDGDPQAGVVVSDGNVYGTTPGLVYKVSADDTGFWVLHRFDGFPGPGPSGLTLSGNTLYGSSQGTGSTGAERCSPSTRMAPVLRTCILSLQASPAVFLHPSSIPTPKGLIRPANWFCQGPHSTGRHQSAAVVAAARCLKSSCRLSSPLFQPEPISFSPGLPMRRGSGSNSPPMSLLR